MKKLLLSRPRGSVFNNNGYWYASVFLPGWPKRRKIPLHAPGSQRTLRADRPRKMAEQALARFWESSLRIEKKDPQGIEVNELCDRYLAHARIYYRRRDGSPSPEVTKIACLLRRFRELFGTYPVSTLQHEDMLRVRDAYIRSGICRQSVNTNISVLKRMFTWALDEALIKAQVKAELTQVSPLKPYRSEARETVPIVSVPREIVDATLPFLVPSTADMVRVHGWTGMRPGELCAMKWSEIDTSVTPWVYRPQSHKNDWRGNPRVICIGPRAREVLDRRRGGVYCFSPMDSVLERFAALRAARKTPLYGKAASAPPAFVGASHPPRDHWDTQSYGVAVRKAAERAGVETWGTNQLRHTFATEVRRKFGLQACRAVLGHSMGGRVTDRYSFEAAEEEFIRIATPAVEELG